jgi:hypothetical protein
VSTNPKPQLDPEAIVWEEPPAPEPEAPPGKYGKVGQALMEKPGHWAKVPTTVANRNEDTVLKSLKRSFPDEVFEVRFGPALGPPANNSGGNVYRYPLYLRYVGPNPYQD